MPSHLNYIINSFLLDIITAPMVRFKKSKYAVPFILCFLVIPLGVSDSALGTTQGDEYTSVGTPSSSPDIFLGNNQSTFSHGSNITIVIESLTSYHYDHMVNLSIDGQIRNTTFASYAITSEPNGDTYYYSFHEYQVDQSIDTRGFHQLYAEAIIENQTGSFLNETVFFEINDYVATDIVDGDVFRQGDDLIFTVETEDSSYNDTNTTAVLHINSTPVSFTTLRNDYYYSYYDYAWVYQIYYIYTVNHSVDTNGTKDLYFAFTDTNGTTESLNRTVTFEIFPPVLAYLSSNIDDNDTFFQGDLLHFQVFSDYSLNDTHMNKSATLLIDNQIAELETHYSYYWYDNSAYNYTQYWRTFSYRVDRRTDTNGTHSISFIFTDVNETTHYLNYTANFSISPTPAPNVSLSSDEIYKWRGVNITVTYPHEVNNSIAFLEIDGESRNFSNLDYNYANPSPTPDYNYSQGVYVYHYQYSLTDLDTNGTHTLHFNWTSEEGTVLTLERQVNFTIEMTHEHSESVEIRSNTDKGFLDTEIIFLNVTSNSYLEEENITLQINETYFLPGEVTYYSTYYGQYVYTYLYNLSSSSVTDGYQLVHFTVIDGNGTIFESINYVYFNISHIVDPDYEEYIVEEYIIPSLFGEITWDGTSSLVFTVRSLESLENTTYTSLYLDGNLYNSSHMLHSFEPLTNQHTAYYTYTFSNNLEVYRNSTQESYLFDFSLHIIGRNITDIEQIESTTRAEVMIYTAPTFVSGVNESNTLTDGEDITILVYSDFMIYNNTILTIGEDNITRSARLQLRSFVDNKFVFEFVYTISSRDPSGNQTLSFYFVDAAGYDYLHTISVVIEQELNETSTSNLPATFNSNLSIGLTSVLLFFGVVSILSTMMIQRTRRKVISKK